MMKYTLTLLMSLCLFALPFFGLSQNSTIKLENGLGSETVEILGEATPDNAHGRVVLKQESGVSGLVLDGGEGDTDGGGQINFYNSDGQVGAQIDAQGTTFSNGSFGGFLELRNSNQEQTAILYSDVSEGRAGRLLLKNDIGVPMVIIDAQQGNPNGAGMELFNWDGVRTILIDAENGGNGPGILGVYNNDGSTGAIIRGTGGSNFYSKVTIYGSDFAERFDLSEASSVSQPGMVVSIDREHPGELRVSDEPYDQLVAGVISGAGGVQTGMLMGQEGTKADGDTPVAIAGRVYAYVDASKTPIRVGDLLTTSKTPGHLMKVKKRKKAIGAIVGKALESLSDGTGLILILLNGQ